MKTIKLPNVACEVTLFPWNNDDGVEILVEDLERFINIGGTIKADGVKIRITNPKATRVRADFGGKISTCSLEVGDCFRFVKPPTGWTSGNLQVVEQMPGFAAPEGWDYFPISILDGEIVRVSPPGHGGGMGGHDDD